MGCVKCTGAESVSGRVVIGMHVVTAETAVHYIRSINLRKGMCHSNVVVMN